METAQKLVGHVMIRKYISLYIVTSVLLSGCWREIISKPVCDPSPVLSLKIPNQIETLARFPRDRTVVEMGIDTRRGTRELYDIKERLILRKAKSEKWLFTEYDLSLCYTEEAARKYFERNKNFYTNPYSRTIYSELNHSEYNFYVLYVVRPRADIEGFHEPSDFYRSRCSFRLRNLVIWVDVRHKEKQSKMLNEAIQQLANLLSNAL